MPVSETEISIHTLPPSRLQFTFNSMLPRCVYLAELLRRLVNICLTLRSSPYSLFGRSSGMLRLNAMGFSPMRVTTRVMTSFKRLDM